MTRLEVLDFMYSCESLLSFVQAQGGAAGLTHDERLTIKLYQDMLSAAMPELDEGLEKAEYRRAA